MPSKPLKKSLPKKRVAKPTGDSPWERGTLPSKGGKCKHPGACFRVQLRGKPLDKDTFHWMDEGGAVMFAMRQSRDGEVAATVYGPDGMVVCDFKPRTYNVAAARHDLLDYNEWQQAHKDVWDQVSAARKERTHKQATLTPTKKKAAPKKSLGGKSLKK